MRIKDFDLSSLPRAAKTRQSLELSGRPGEGDWSLPLMSITGDTDGPTLLVMAGVHGDEYEGITAIPQVFAAIESEQLHGTLVMAPVCNPPAYRAAQRSSPIDGLNLARVFPGAINGSITQRIAYWIGEKLLRHADLMVDLHTGGIAYELPLLVGYVHDDGALGQASLAAASAFGAPVLWGHPPPLPPGRSLSTATDLGIPCAYTEAPGKAGIDPDVVDCYREGVFNVMKHLGMLSGDPVRRVLKHHLVGHGDLDSVIAASVAGLFQRERDLLDEVVAGQRLGVIRDESGLILEEIIAKSAGVVIMLRGLPRVEAGDGLVHIAQRYRS